MPAGLQGMMVAAMLAALMSSLSAVFNSSSTIFTMDFYKKFKPEASEKELVNVGRVATVIMVVLGVAWIPFMSRVSSQLWLYLQSVQAYISPPITAVFLLGVFWRRINGHGALAALIAGFLLGGIRFVLEVGFGGAIPPGFLGWYIGMNFLHFAVLMFAICVAILVIVSLLTPAPATRKVSGLTWQTVREEILQDRTVASALVVAEETSAQRRLNVIFAGVLVATIVSLWIYFA
jgi:SSS family solute:Na+ symporter